MQDRWTNLSIWLHWLIVVLLIAQFAEGEWMGDLFNASQEHPADGTAVLFGYTHMVIGGIILLAAIVRLWDRFAHGRPPYSADEPGWARGLAKAIHIGLYGLLIAMPVVGAAAWFSGSEILGEVHETAWSVLLVLAAIHVVGALVHHFWFRTDVLRNMLPGHGRTA